MTATPTSPTALPGPHPMPVLGWRGNALSFGLDPVAHMHRLNQTYGNIVALARGRTDYVFVFGPEYNQQVLGNPDAFHASDADNGPIRLTQGTALARIFSNPSSPTACLTCIRGPISFYRSAGWASIPRRTNISRFPPARACAWEPRLPCWR